MRISLLAALAVCAVGAANAVAEELPPGYWPPERTPEILDLTKTVRLAPSLADLTAGERRALQELLEAGKILQRIYEDSLHPQALQSFDTLVQLSARMAQPPETEALLDLYRLFKGPIATTRDNRREAFLPVHPETAARNVYPSNATRAEIEAYLLAHPDERDELLAPRSIVRRATEDNLKQDLETLRRYPSLDHLHFGLRRKLQTLQTAADETALYTIPQSLRWAPELTRVYQRLNNAARHVEGSDAEFARYLRNRARDLLSDDYESGDASWVMGEFRRLNAQIGSYETYDDALFGRKAFMSMSLLKRDEAASKRVREHVRDLQGLEDALPTPQHRRVREDIPIGVYDVIADFGQARGQNGAMTLPNDPLFAKRYGRTILLRANVLRNPDLFANAQAAWKAVMASPYDGDFSEDGELNRVLWHEIGHYLGPDRDRRGRPLDAGLQSHADVFEELKSDLIALFAAGWLQKSGVYVEQDMVSVYASGVNRMLLDAKPRGEHPYQAMQLMQFNWFYERGVIELEPVTGGVVIRYARFADAAAAMLEAVLKIQFEGDRAAAEEFMTRWSAWRDELHEPIAKTLRDNRTFQYALIRYGALGE
jgi:hypothetical protein